MIQTELTKLLGISYPIIGAPMFLVSNERMVIEISEAGAIGTFPALNYRPIEKYKEALKNIQSQTQKPFGVNVIVNKSNSRQQEDFTLAIEHGAKLLITSLGNPKHVIEEAHKNNVKVFCDVTNLTHAQKVQDMGADGIIAVGSGAGGHAGPISPVVLIPWLKTKIQIPIIAAGGVTNGATLASMLALGASGASIGTRFITSQEAQVDFAYKQAILDSSPEDIILTKRISGTPASVIATDFVKKHGSDLPWFVEQLSKNPLTKKYIVPLIHLSGMKALEKAATAPTWKTVWSAGQGVGLIDEIKTCREIVEEIVRDYQNVKSQMP